MSNYLAGRVVVRVDGGQGAGRVGLVCGFNAFFDGFAKGLMTSQEDAVRLSSPGTALPRRRGGAKMTGVGAVRVEA
ncbi:hypothetical protein ABH935_010079, partial [Catenulispora sp. GAS73]|uniref:hypothetical protein n=1 Tax=Catenulispora sp. GAS73 TaxID=3156269 RepID=UPI003514B93E